LLVHLLDHYISNMKYFSSKSDIQFSWEQVMNGFWHRYPNPYSTHVLTEDTISRQIVNKKLHTCRLITKMNKVPKWGEHFFKGPKFVCVVEESILDPKAKTMTTYTRNVGYSKVMLIEEKCVYKPSTSNKGWTECEKQAWITSNVFGFAYALQSIGLERFKSNAVKTLKGFEHVLTKMYKPHLLAESSLLATNTEKLKTQAIKAKDLVTEKADLAKEIAKQKTDLAKEIAKEKAHLTKEKTAEQVSKVKDLAKEKAASKFYNPTS